MVKLFDFKNSKKSQIALEFMVIYSFVIVIFIIIFALIANQRAQTLAQQQASLMDLLAQTVAGYINQAVVAGNGYSASIPLASVIGVSPYNISISSTGVVLASVSIGKEVVSGEAFSDTGSLIVNGTQIASSNGIGLYRIPAYKGTVYISNQKGIIYIDAIPPSLNSLSGSVSMVQSSGIYAPIFNGSNSVITAGYSLKTGSSVTVSAWVYLSSLSSVNPIVEGWNGTTTAYALTTDGTGRIDFVVCNSGCATEDSVASTAELATGGWYNVAGTYNSVSGIGTIYLNGYAVATSTKTLTMKNSNAIFIGGVPSSGAYLHGIIADIQTYSTSLSSNQISLLYNSGTSSPPANFTAYLTGYWPLNGNANDYSGYGSDGTANNVVFSPVAAITTKVLANSGSPEYGVPVTFWAGNNLIDGSNSTTLLTYNDGSASTLIQSNAFSGGKLNVYSSVFNGNLSTLGSLVRWWQISNQRGSMVVGFAGGNVNGTANNITYEPLSNSTNFEVADFNGANSMLATNSVISTNAFTIAFWTKVSNALIHDSYDAYDFINSSGFNGTILQFYNEGSCSPTCVGYADPAITLSAGSQYASDTLQCCSGTIYAINDSEWNFVAVTVNGTPVPGGFSSVSADFYINGTLYPGTLYTGPPYTFNKLAIGQKGYNGDYFAGNISNFQLYGSALSASQLSSIYKQGISGSPVSNSNLLLWYPLFGTAENYANSNVSSNAVSISYQNLQNINITASLKSSAFYTQSNKNSTSVALLSSSVPIFNGQDSFVTLHSFDKPFSSGTMCNLTITAWAYDSGMPITKGYVLDFPALSSGNGYSYILYNDSSITYGIGTSGAGNYWSVAGSYKGRWILLTIEVINGNATSYLNGVSVGSAPTRHIGCLSGYGEGVSGIGYSGVMSNGHYFNGSIEDVQVYNSSLSHAQLEQLYTQGVPIVESLNVSIG